MAVTVSSIITNINTHIGDSSNDRVTEAQRLQAITEATAWLLEELGNEHMVEVYELNYLDTINQYRVTGSIPDLLTGADLRRAQDNYYSFARKSPRELSEEIARKDREPSWAIERRDSDTYLIINAEPKNSATIITYLDSLTNGGGEWVLDGTNSDAENISVDTYEKKYGVGSIKFDVDVSNSGNNRATMYNDDVDNENISEFENIGSLLVEVYIPTVTYVTSFTAVWGTGDDLTPATKASYWTATVTTDIEGNAFQAGWNTLEFTWSAATEVGTPDSESCNYFEIVMNYSASQADMEGVRYNFLRWARPEKLEFHYISWNVGQVSAADETPLTVFTATTNVPFFSDKYDQYRYCVAQKAASIIFADLRLKDESNVWDAKAFDSLTRYRKNFESSKVRPVKSWKIMGVNLRRRNRSSRLR